MDIPNSPFRMDFKVQENKSIFVALGDATTQLDVWQPL